MKRNAFSLMELLLVLALLAGLAALSIPGLGRLFGRGESLRQDAHHVAQQLRVARQLALDHAAPVCIQIAASQDHAFYFLQRDAQQRQRIDLRSGHLFGAATQSPGQLPQVSLIFREDGSSTGGDLQLHTEAALIRVHVERSTGQVTVEEAS